MINSIILRIKFCQRLDAEFFKIKIYTKSVIKNNKRLVENVKKSN